MLPRIRQDQRKHRLLPETCLHLLWFLGNLDNARVGYSVVFSCSELKKYRYQERISDELDLTEVLLPRVGARGE